MTWAPGEGMFVKDRLVTDCGGWVERGGVSCLNLYRPPIIAPGVASEARPWVDHVERVFGDASAHIINWCAHRVQRPQEKINHALVLGGSQGIGKDTMLEPVKYAIGPHNFADASPAQVLGASMGS